MKLKFIYNKIIQSFFFSLYGKIRIKNVDFKKIKITKINYIDKLNVKKFKYRIIQIKEGRVFTNFVENVAYKRFLKK